MTNLVKLSKQDKNGVVDNKHFQFIGSEKSAFEEYRRKLKRAFKQTSNPRKLLDKHLDSLVNYHQKGINQYTNIKLVLLLFMAQEQTSDL